MTVEKTMAARQYIIKPATFSVSPCFPCAELDFIGFLTRFDGSIQDLVNSLDLLVGRSMEYNND
jgi:hypothetical protein